MLSAAGVVFLEGEAAPIFDLLMTDANYGITTLAPTAQVIQKNFTYDDYAQAIQREQAIQTSQAPPTNCPTVAGLTPGDLAIAFGGLTSSGNANADPSWSGRPRGKFVVATPWETDQWQGDIYNHNGFSNVTNYTITGDKTIDYVAQVSFGGITQMMAPPSP